MLILTSTPAATLVMLAINGSSKTLIHHELKMFTSARIVVALLVNNTMMVTTAFCHRLVVGLMPMLSSAKVV